jgi:mycothiol synthase
MTTSFSRPYQGEEDYAQMQDLARRCYAHSPRVYCTPGDLDYWRSEEADPDRLNAQLWFDGELLVGFGWPSDEQIDVVVDPAHPELVEQILSWGEGRRRAAELSAGQERRLSAWSYIGDTTRAATLAQRGYQRTLTALDLRIRTLDQALPTITVAEGYRVRSLAGQDEIVARVEVHRDAFAPSRMTTRRYEVLSRMPIYRRDLDLVAVAPDGSFAAFCIVWYDAVLQIGVFEPVGCHSAHRRRGLARAVMVEGLRRLIELGARTAHVTSLAGNRPAEDLYESLGFGVLDRNERWDCIL